MSQQFPPFEAGSLEESTYQSLLAQGKSQVYAYSYASKVRDGEVFAKHFAIIRCVIRGCF